MHFCQDEVGVIAMIFGGGIAACKYCWHKVCGIFRK